MKRIMLAEDDETMISLMKTLLKLEGHQVSTLMDQPGDPLDTLKQQQPDILLMDVHLGDRNGLDLMAAIRAEAALQDMKVIMISGMNLQAECLAAGAEGFLLKPYMPDELMRMIDG